MFMSYKRCNCTFNCTRSDCTSQQRNGKKGMADWISIQDVLAKICTTTMYKIPMKIKDTDGKMKNGNQPNHPPSRPLYWLDRPDVRLYVHQMYAKEIDSDEDN